MLFDNAFPWPDPNSSINININNNNISGYPIGLEENAGGYTGGPNSLDGTNNWWGSPTAPTIASNPGGTGELIIDEDGVVKYSPFLTFSVNGALLLRSCAPVFFQTALQLGVSIVFFENGVGIYPGTGSGLFRLTDFTVTP